MKPETPNTARPGRQVAHWMGGGWIWFAALAALVVVASTGIALAHPADWGGGYGPMMGYGPGRWGGHGHGIIIMLVGLLVLGALVAVIVRWGCHRCGHRRHPRATAIDILTERYARGEIDTKEFDERKRTLES